MVPVVNWDVEGVNDINNSRVCFTLFPVVDKNPEGVNIEKNKYHSTKLLTHVGKTAGYFPSYPQLQQQIDVS